ncbi:tetratricopeptide repeat protein [Erythrobacter sp. SG61-1L]|uniref:tetratricopeptide repeat protein n=1 Tax=Erythrobacter sp. SG61-1L TaxID=1603897 RepID=UPI0006C934D6|nr:tetratricopeptide repeat protein [Erythrobacter sp. SG61-1L]
MQAETQSRLELLLSYLGHDPDNPNLLRDCAAAAMELGDLAKAKHLFARLRDVGELTDADSNLWAIAAMRSGEPELAAETFAGLLERNPGNHGLAFNLAWARALAGDNEGALALLSEDLTEALPQAAQLEVHLLHASGLFDKAEHRARAHLAQHGDYPPFAAAVSVLALDVEDEGLARAMAEKGGTHPDALTTLGTLTLGDQQPEEARAMFEQALALSPNSPRAWVGLGLADLLQGNAATAGERLDKGAEIFGDHLGSWIAAGWAYLIAGDLPTARARFEQAVALDGTFAEAQGSLAVAELLTGQREEATRRAEVALRLDRHCFSAAFVQILLNAADGNPERAQRIMEMALKQPLGADGRTIADAIARMAR